MTIEILYGQVVVKTERNELTFDYHKSWGVGVEIEHPSDYFTSRSSDGLTVSVEDWRLIVAHIDEQIAVSEASDLNPSTDLADANEACRLMGHYRRSESDLFAPDAKPESA